MPRLLHRGLQGALDVGVLTLALLVAFLFRFEFAIPATYRETMLVSWPYVVVLQYALIAAFGIPRRSWRYVNMRDAVYLGVCIVTSGAILVLLRLTLDDAWPLDVVALPLGVVGMDIVLAYLGLVAVRAVRRLHGEHRERPRQGTGGAPTRILLIGAGQAGVLIAREIAARPDLGLHAVGFLDDDPMKAGARIGGLPVLGTTLDLTSVAASKRVKRVLITIANAPGHEIRRIHGLCQSAGLEAKIIPGLYEIVGDRLSLSRMREVAIEDLLGRDPVSLDTDQISDSIRGRVVLVTGAGGSIGSELCRQLCRFAPSRLVLVERFENALFDIHRELIAAFPAIDIRPQVGDVCDARRMEVVFASHQPDAVFHAAAHKHVPMMEWNVGESIKNNVGGTRVIADLADRFGVSQFVMISTDKAVNPTSVMGATKRIAEIYTQALSLRSKTRFVTVRFGNVLGSAGSVIPIFKEQIARGGPLTITDPEMRRYFMTIPEAAQLVVQAGAMGAGGEIFILDMGKPVKIVDLARDLITLSGLRPDDDIEITFTGLRPGEKLFEELSTDAEHAEKTRHPKIFIGRIRPHEWTDVLRGIDTLTEQADHLSTDELRASLCALVPEYRRCQPPPAPSREPVREPSRVGRGTAPEVRAIVAQGV
jgi:FlaA1/EpsC-like NDP-sugar epimerase